jgi:hypothetical protein
MRAGSSMCDRPIQPRPSGHQIPLTPMQLRTWKQSRAGNVGLFGTRLMCAAAVRILGCLEVDLLRRSMDAVMRRHEALRTRFVAIDGIPRQQVTSDCTLEFDALELPKLDHLAVESSIKQIYYEFVKAKIDVSIEPLVAAKLVRVSARNHILMYALDHAICDGTSLGIFEKEIWTQYRQAYDGNPFSLPELAVQFGDYAIWLQQTYSDWLSRNQAYWRDRLSGAPRIMLPRGSSSQTQDPDGALFECQFEKKLTKGLKNIASQERTLFPLVVLAIYIAVMSRWCEREDLLLTVVSTSRHHLELHPMIGYLASQLHLRLAVTESDSFISILDKVRREFLTALSHEDFDRVPDFIPERERYPELHFNWLPSCISQPSFEFLRTPIDILEVQPYPCKVPWPVSFLPHFSESAQGVELTVRYLPHEFSSRVVEGFCDAVRLYAEEFVHHGTTKIALCPSPCV